MIRKLEEIKTLQGFKNSADGGQAEICNGKRKECLVNYVSRQICEGIFHLQG